MSERKVEMMGYVEFDSRFFENKKMRRVGMGTRVFYLAVLCWCGKNRADKKRAGGFVPDEALAEIAATTRTEDLDLKLHELSDTEKFTAAGFKSSLWIRVPKDGSTPGGYQISRDRREDPKWRLSEESEAAPMHEQCSSMLPALLKHHRALLKHHRA